MDRKSYDKRLQALKNERSSFIDYWRELADFTLAHRGKFLNNDPNKGYKRNTRQINNTARLGLRTLQAGMMTGLTNPAKQWFKLNTPDTQLMDVQAVRQWLHDVETKMYAVFSRSNLYRTLSGVYAELGCFGVASMGVYEDFDNVIRCQQYTVGSFLLGINGRSEVDTHYREYSVSVGQCVKEFGLENCSQSVQDNWRNGNTERRVEIVHAIEPNDDRDRMKPTAFNMPIRSVYYEKGTKQDIYLRKSGFEEFPIMSPRWEVLGEEVYSNTSPAMDALGDNKSLQISESKKMTAVDKMVDPPLQVPHELGNQIYDGGTFPGDVYVLSNPSNGARPIYDVRPDVMALRDDMKESEFRIKRALYEDLFLMLANTDRRQITAREIAERHEEKLLMLSPVLERLFNELLDPLITRTFSIMQRNGALPPAPQELAGQDLKVDYVSSLAQAMKATSLSGIEQVAGYVGQLAQIFPEARHKFNAGESVDQYSRDVGLSPKLIRSDEEVEAIVQAEQQAAQQAQMMEQMAQVAQAAKTASDIDMAGDNPVANAVNQ